MSNYSQITRHPLTGSYALADWKDDYFGPHRYGVKFPDDDVVYPAEQVNEAQLKEFWAADVMQAVEDFLVVNPDHAGMSRDEVLLGFLYTLGQVYKARWKRDPAHGEGAVEYYRSKFSRENLSHLDEQRELTVQDESNATDVLR